MKRFIKYILVLSFVCFNSQLFAADTLASVLRPRIGLGTGTFTYYGEIQNYQKKFSPVVNRYGGLLYVNAPISRMFNLEFSASYGRIAANERTLARNFNFESRVRMGTVYLYYNFYPLFQSKRAIYHPFLGVGVSSFEFLSKTDLYDANGNMYHYWSDGSIMSLPQNDPLALTNAVPLQRDYFYETDLREQNFDSLGKYKEQSFAFPVSLGFELHLSPRWDFRLAATYHFTLTDLIDNISPAGEGIRNGDKSKDRLLYSSVSLSYDLMFGSKQDEFIDDEELPLFAEWDMNDWDRDGVIDALDDCPSTPFEALVDDKGCPLDGDGDGVPDYNDDELNTPKGNYVDDFGVTITKEQFDRHWLLFNDSTGYDHEFAEERTTVVFWKSDKIARTNPYTLPAGKSYVIIVGKEHKDVSANDLHKYLGYNEYKTIMRGDTVYYVLGEYASIAEAVAAKTELENKGVDVDLIGKDNVNNGTLTPVDSAVVSKVEKINTQDGVGGPDYGVPQQVFRVQIGAFKNKIDTETAFPGLNVVHGTGKDGITRYYSGNFTTYEEAEAYRKEMVKKGYANAFVVAYEDQERKTLKEIGIDPNKLPENYNENKELSTFVEPRDTTNIDTTHSNSNVDMSKVKYRVKLAYFPGDVPIETVNILYNIGGVKPVKGIDGSTTYYSRQLESERDIENAMLDYKTYGLDKMEGAVEYDGKYYTLAEFKKLLEE